MKVGTKSLLFGVHCWFIHPIAIFVAWWRLYGFPWDPRLYVCFLVHDWGYFSSPNMDQWEGKRHPSTGAAIAGKLFGQEWYDMVLLHSRHYAAMMGREPSKLCAPDKLASCIYPEWLYLTLATLSGEIKEYMRPENCTVLRDRTGLAISDKRTWFRALKAYLELEAERTAA